MSSTQMDLSPHEIDRKQDITSWPEGDITGSTTRDRNRYRRRKSALLDYFQTELSLEEIASRHRLPPGELAGLVRRCLVRHVDGRLWGFRALMPGIPRTERPASADPGPSDPGSRSLEDEDEDTVEREAVHLPGAMSKESAPEVEQCTAEETVCADPAVPEAAADAGQETAGGGVEQAVPPLLDVVDTEAGTTRESLLHDVPGEEQTGTLEQWEGLREGQVSQAEEVGEQEADEALVECAKSEVGGAKGFAGPASEGAGNEREEENTTQTLVGELHLQEEREAQTIGAQEEVTEGDPAEVATCEAQKEREAAVGREAQAVDEQGEVTEGDPGEAATSEAQGERETQAVDEQGEVAEAATSEAQKEGEAAVEAQAISEQREVAEKDPGEAATSEAQEEREAAVEAQAISEQREVAEEDTGEAATREAIRERVSNADTLIVPASMSGAQERAERQIAAEAETLEISAVSSKARSNGHAGNLQVQKQSDAGQPVQVRNVQAPTQPLVEGGRYRVTGSQLALRYTLLRRWGKLGRQRKRQQLTRIISAAVVAAILVALAIPLCVGLVGYRTYANIKDAATEGVDNLLALQTLIPANKNDLTAVLNAQKLEAAKTRLGKAQSDFLQLQDMVNRPDIQSLLQQFAPQYSGKLDMARRLVTVALDVSRMGQELVGVAQMGTNILHGGSLLSPGSKKPLVTADDINAIEAALVHAQYYIGDIQTLMGQVNLAQVPFGTASQKARLAGYLHLLPQVQGTVAQVQSLVGPIAWLLGVGSTRHYLVQTLDRAELRPSGGFEGQYGVITVNNGRLGPVSLTDIAKLDYGENGNELGNHPPALYKWMDFGNFGVRDANLSADFPTTAKMVMQLFQLEGGGPVDGDIQFTPVLIEQLLQMTGSLSVKEYGETITARNLEDKLHLYQQNYHYIDLQAAKTGQYTHQTRKAFTSLVGQLLLDRARHLSMTQLMTFGKILLKDLKSRDLQVYFSNPVAEQWLARNNYSGAMPRFVSGIDGFMVVQANVSISKASQYVHSTFSDQVTLNPDRSATHQLTITLNYDQRGPVYGYDTYADYVRVYVPANAQFLDGYGFDSGHALCTPGGKTTTGGTGGTGTGKTTGCSQYNGQFPSNGARSCPNGVYTLGYDGMIAKPFPIDSLGGPTATRSDLPGYQMWGGLTLTPKNCTTTLTLSWVTPHIVQNTPGRPPYQMIVGHQAGWPVTAQIAVDASAFKGVKNFSFNQTINVDTLVALPARPLPPPQQKPVTPVPAATPTATAKKA